MAEKKYYVGTHGPYFYDDADDIDDPDGDFSGEKRRGITTDGQIKVDTKPGDNKEIVRMEDLEDGSILDGDMIDIDYSPTNYTPTTAGGLVTDTGRLAAHLEGIDNELGNSHVRLHAMTSVNDHEAGDWKMFYSDDSGHVNEITFSDAGKVLTSNGASMAPSFQTVSTSGGSVTALWTDDTVAYTSAQSGITGGYTSNIIYPDNNAVLMLADTDDRMQAYIQIGDPFTPAVKSDAAIWTAGGLFINIEEDTADANGYGAATVLFHHTSTALDNTTGYRIGFSALAESTYLDGATIFGAWTVAAGPTADVGTLGWAICGMEINTMERYADQGKKTARTGRFSIGLAMVPENGLNFGSGNIRGYHNTFGIGFSHSAADGSWDYAKWHTGIFFEANSIAPDGTCIYIGGGASEAWSGTGTAKTAVTNAPNEGIKFDGTFEYGIDLQSGTYNSDSAAIILAENHKIRLGTSSIFLDGTNLQIYSGTGDGINIDATSAVKINAYSDASVIDMKKDGSSNDYIELKSTFVALSAATNYTVGVNYSGGIYAFSPFYNTETYGMHLGRSGYPWRTVWGKNWYLLDANGNVSVPTSDPTEAGRVWRDGTTLKVSLG